MTRRSLLLSMLGMGSIVPNVDATGRGLKVTGLLSAADHEKDAGWTALGQEIAIVAKPDTTAYRELVALVGEEVCLSITPRECL